MHVQYVTHVRMHMPRSIVDVHTQLLTRVLTLTSLFDQSTLVFMCSFTHALKDALTCVVTYLVTCVRPHWFTFSLDPTLAIPALLTMFKLPMLLNDFTHLLLDDEHLVSWLSINQLNNKYWLDSC